MDNNIYGFSNEKSSEEVLFAEEFNSDEELFFAYEVSEDSQTENWKILIVDDEAKVHTATDIALRKFVYENKYLKFISAYSAKDAKQLIQEHPDVAIILLDVIMETDGANYFTHESTRTSTRKKRYY